MIKKFDFFNQKTINSHTSTIAVNGFTTPTEFLKFMFHSHQIVVNVTAYPKEKTFLNQRLSKEYFKLSTYTTNLNFLPEFLKIESSRPPIFGDFIHHYNKIIKSHLFQLKGDIPKLIDHYRSLLDLNNMKEADKKLQIEVEKKTAHLEKVTQELKTSVKSLKESNEELENFAYVTSHDLQEPLRQIATFTQLLSKKLDGKLDEAEQKYLTLITEGTSHMQHLIDDLLYYSRLTRHPYDYTSVNINLIIKKAVNLLKEQIENCNATITFGDLPIIKGIPVLITQLFHNLISNAIKYRKENVNPKIEISFNETANEWLFSVKDNGIGIDANFYDRIFKLFKRLHTKREYSGNGIGLTLCKKIVTQHDGKIWVESNKDQGSVFYFTISKKL
ncbi:sensor histidine kinase [Chondrinema litorale]|uniref:sensor histidine kinase n=1 Tax=Chondrinema litorale TaxID=2994555 RepID=UPI002542B05B|nr:ATP-binding protein [Chondrinema litorale]UZR98154.1 ATP-binding protein [Chondrinema litorale]